MTCPRPGCAGLIVLDDEPNNPGDWLMCVNCGWRGGGQENNKEFRALVKNARACEPLPQPAAKRRGRPRLSAEQVARRVALKKKVTVTAHGMKMKLWHYTQGHHVPDISAMMTYKKPQRGPLS